MSREIKFRAWDEKRKRMFTPHSQNSGVTIAQKNFFVGINSNGLEVSEYEGKGYWRILPVMQYTGLQDKNGKEIYEGDIVEWNPWGGYKEITPIEWDQDMCRFVCRSKDGTWRMFANDLSFEVIGNMYENPKLIEVTT